MGYILFKDQSEAVKGSVQQVSSNVIRLSFSNDIPEADTSGFDYFIDKNLKLKITSAEEYTTLYATYKDGFALSNDGSVYTPTTDDLDDSSDKELTDEEKEQLQKELEEQQKREYYESLIPTNSELSDGLVDVADVQSDDEDALVELASSVSELEDALVELAELVSASSN